MGKFFQKRSEIPIVQSDENPKIYITKADIGYMTNRGEFIYIKAGYKTDGYSKPLITKALVDGSFGDDLRPAVIHDFLCQCKGFYDKIGNYYPVSFKRANSLFLEAMKDAKMSFLRRWTYYLAVQFNKNKW